MASYTHNDTLEHHPQDALSSPTRAYYPPTKSTAMPSSLSTAISEKLAATLASKKPYINLPSIQKVIANHSNIKSEETDAPGYDETIANIPVLDLLPPPPVYDIVNCSTTQTLLLVSSLINTILAVNDRLACPKITLFHSRAIPNISIEAYLSRILQYAPFQNEVLLIILLYFDRIGGGCKPTQVLTNTFPKSLLRQANLTMKDINKLTTPKSEQGEDMNWGRDEKVLHGHDDAEAVDIDSDTTDEEDGVADEIYTSSTESPVGSKLIINSFNIHRLLITSILVASKVSSDVFYPNVRYARVGGLPLTELNKLEVEFLFLSQFGLNTTEAELQAYGNKLLMYHQRLNGTERAAVDAITPAKGEYVRLNEKKPQPENMPMPTRIQTSVSSPLRPSSETESRPFGSYRDSREIIDDDEVMSVKDDHAIGSPRDWHSGPSTPVTAEIPVSKFPAQHQRSNKMNLDHMIWPTNDTETKYNSSSYYGSMVKDEDAARIEEEFNKASPPPDSDEPNPKRKLQRLSSGTLETVPAKRVNNPGKGMSSEKSGQPGSNNKNILKPLFRKIASLASNRSDVASIPEPEPSPQPPSLRSHPYLVRYRVSPASSSTNLADPEETMMTSPTTPTARTMNWQSDEFSNQSRTHSGTQVKPPPPYSGQNQEYEKERQSHPKTSGSTNIRRQHRSREPSLSTLTSELTFEPTRPSLSPMSEESDPNSDSATLAPLYFPPKPQSIQSPRTVQHYPQMHAPDSMQGYSTPPDTPMSRRERSVSDARSMREHSHDYQSTTSSSSSKAPMMTSPSSEMDDYAMQCDEELVTSPRPMASSRPFHSEPLAVSGSESKEFMHKMRASERIETGGLDPSSSSPAQPPPSLIHGHGALVNDAANRQWTPRQTPVPAHTVIPYPHPHHPHFVASYHHGHNMQLLSESTAMGSPVAVAAAMAPRPGVMAIPRNPQLLPGVGSNIMISAAPSGKQPLAPATPRPARQFAPIRPRTPMTVEEDAKIRAAQAETSALTTTQKKKKASISSDSRVHVPPQPLRPLVPTTVLAAATTAAAAPPPYRPPLIAYSSPYGPQLRAPDGSPIRPPAPMLMAVDYPAGALAAAGHPPQFIAAPGGGLSGAGVVSMAGHGHPGAPTRLYIPVIPVMYNKPPHALAPAMPLLPAGKAPSKANTPAKIAPRIHRAP